MARWIAGTLTLGLLLGGLNGCAAISGYPTDPEDTDAILTTLKPYLDPSKDADYYKATAADRQDLRNMIVLSRMRAFNIEFDNFEKGLWEDGNTATIGTDLTALALSTLATTVHGAATKTAYSAAATGVLGAGAAISKDLYYQKTLPALIAQMEANRAKAQRIILAGLQKTDSAYPLAAAEIDLDALKKAGSVPDAIGNMTQSASAQKDAETQRLAAVRSLPGSTSTSTKQLIAWVANNQSNFDNLAAWMQADPIDPVLRDITPEQLIGGADPTLEIDRGRAIAQLHVP